MCKGPENADLLTVTMLQYGLHVGAAIILIAMPSYFSLVEKFDPVLLPGPHTIYYLLFKTYYCDNSF